MIERSESRSESISPHVQEKFSRFIQLQKEEFSSVSTHYRLEPESLFAVVSTEDGKGSDIKRRFYTNIGTEALPSFRIAQELFVQKNDDFTCLQLEAHVPTRGVMQEFSMVLSQNHIHSMNYDEFRSQKSLGISYSPHNILSVQVMEDSEDAVYKKELLESSLVYISPDILKSTKPTYLSLPRENYVLLASPQTLHIIRSIDEDGFDELSVPTFINGERVIHDLGLQLFIGELESSYQLPAGTDKWQKSSYSDYLDIEWLSK